jgi:hypothetical protein
MGFIEAIRGNKSVGIAVASSLLEARSNRIPANLTKSYYSTDDGKTFFVDDLDKAYPFDHDGQQAYRAFVYKGASGAPFVAYLERYTANGLARKQDLIAHPVDDGGFAAAELLRSEIEVEKPGTNKWVSALSPKAGPVVRPDDPTAREVYP